MQIYSFWSADTTYLTKSASVKKAQQVGQDNFKHYSETCAYLGEEATAGSDYFIPTEVNKERLEWVRHLIKVDNDILVLETETEEYINQA